MDWFRAYHGILTDAKLDRIKRKVGCPRGLVVAAWLAVLEAASENDQRGNVGDLDAGDIAYKVDIKLPLAGRILGAIREAGMVLDDGTVSAWSKRQRASDDVKVRVSEHRARKSKSLKNNETTGSGNVTETYRTEQSRVEEDSSLRSESCPPPSAAAEKRPASNRAPRAAVKEVEGFEQFWDLYPRRIKRPRAAEAFAKAVKLTDLATILQGVHNYIATKPTHQDYAHPASWLNDARWADVENVGQGEGVNTRHNLAPPQEQRGVMAAGRRAMERIHVNGRTGRDDNPGAGEAPLVGLPLHRQGAERG